MGNCNFLYGSPLFVRLDLKQTEFSHSVFDPGGESTVISRIYPTLLPEHEISLDSVYSVDRVNRKNSLYAFGDELGNG